MLQVCEVDGGDLRRMVDFGGAVAAEMQGWLSLEQLFSASVGTAELVGTLGLRLEHRSGVGWCLSGRKPLLPVGERRPAGTRGSVAASGEFACACPVCAHQQLVGG